MMPLMMSLMTSIMAGRFKYEEKKSSIFGKYPELAWVKEKLQKREIDR